MSENTINTSMRRLGYTSDDMTAHGFRAMASTLLNESGKWSSDAIERALAHKDKDAVRAAYHRGAYWAERVEMATWWEDCLDRAGAEGRLRASPLLTTAALTLKMGFRSCAAASPERAGRQNCDDSARD